MQRASWEPRFWGKVNKTNSCWLWVGTRTRKGYGVFHLEGRQRRAHRIAYELLVGTIAEGLMVDHICHTKHCVNPEHLRAVTNKQNGENHSGPTQRNTSGVRGVHWCNTNSHWVARVGHNMRIVHVGYFEDLRDAAEAVRLKRNELFTHNDND